MSMWSCAAVTAALLATLLGGCRDAEQNRPLSYQKGVYRGPADTPVSAEARQALNERLALVRESERIAQGAGAAMPGPEPARRRVAPSERRRVTN